jgi:hypothetical protein
MAALEESAAHPLHPDHLRSSMNRRRAAALTLLLAPVMAILAIIPALPAVHAGQGPGARQGAPAHHTPTPAPPAAPGLALLDGVELRVESPFLPDAAFGATEPDNAIQVAAAIERAPLYREFSITAAPFGTSPPTEALPPARPGGAKEYQTALIGFREQQGADPQPGPVARLFGRKVVGTLSVVHLHVGGLDPAPVAVVEWVVEAGERLWIFRASQALSAEETAGQRKVTLPAQLEGTEVSSPDPAAPSTSLAAARSLQEPPLAIELDARASRARGDDLPFPAWWDGECDYNYYSPLAEQGSFILGTQLEPTTAPAVYRNVRACGPRPWGDDAPDISVAFFPGAHQQLEWQCPELSKRFLYLAYGIEPYGANGNQVVWNYSGDQLEKIANGTAGVAPQPDDVLSYESGTYGHTSVVAESHVDASGNGHVIVIEQNASATGYAHLNVYSWVVSPTWSSVSGWLHRPEEDQSRIVLVVLVRRVDSLEGSISGAVWHDLCDGAGGDGCVQLPGGAYLANGILESGEPGIGDVIVSLGTGSCPSTTGIVTATTEISGTYTFEGLTYGEYCVSVDPLEPVNEPILLPGLWSHPITNTTAVASEDVYVSVADDETGIDFGWDYESIPPP